MRTKSALSLATLRGTASWRAKTPLWLLLGCVLGLTAGCGQKGPLTLPDAAKGAGTPAASAPASR